MQSMQVIVLAGRKGGVGKTTLAGLLAVRAERDGAGPVAIIDMDEQGSLASWWNARKEETPSFVRVGEGVFNGRSTASGTPAPGSS
jgi:chromosome partitioning protein